MSTDTIRVLLVDDEPEVTRALRTGLRKEPWEICTATGGHEALERMAETSFDVIVSDERMPGMAGSELLSQVRESYPDTIRIVLSGHANLEAAIRAINSAEIYRFLLKPCSPQEVGLTIHEALEKRAERLRFEAWREAQREREQGGLKRTLEHALETLWMGYQPIVHCADRSVCAHEALMRSDDAQLATPEALLAAAEELGRSRELGRRVRARVAEDLQGGPEGTLVLVNVDPSHLEDEELYSPDAPLSAFADYVVLEITERDQLGNPDALQQRFDALRDLGYRLAVDDLGAGYAGLTSVSLLTPEFIKLDMELIRNIHRSPTKRELVATLIAMSRKLGMRSIVEGVESAEEFETIAQLDADLVQGFYFGGARRGLPEDAGRRAA